MRFSWLVLAFLAITQAQKIFVVQEGAPVGTFIGKIDSPGPYFIADHDGDSQDSSKAEDDFIINSSNGEIRTRRLLDRETSADLRRTEELCIDCYRHQATPIG